MEKETLKNMKFGPEKLKNIWYFYKWYILIGAAALVLCVTLIVTCAAKKDADLYLYWAGPRAFTKGAQEEISAAFGRAISRKNADTISMITTVYGKDADVGMSDEERERYEKEQVYPDHTGEHATIREFKDQMRLPNTVICLLSEELYKTAVADGETLRTLDGLFETLPEGVTEDHCGIRLSSLPIYRLKALQNLPEDTILCIKSPSIFRKKSDYNKAVSAFCEIVSYDPG